VGFFPIYTCPHGTPASIRIGKRGGENIKNNEIQSGYKQRGRRRERKR
jgi:hypothetical protein